MQAKYTVNRFNEKGLDDTFAGRGYDRICKYPEYLLFGAGEGAHYRFAEKSLFLGEIHSSWAGVLFYYGIIDLYCSIYFCLKSQEKYHGLAYCFYHQYLMDLPLTIFVIGISG